MAQPGEGYAREWATPPAPGPADWKRDADELISATRVHRVVTTSLPGDSPGSISLKSQRMRELWSDPDFRARSIAALKRKWEDPEFRAKRAAASAEVLRRLRKDPRFEERRRAASRKGAWPARPEPRALTRLRDEARAIERRLAELTGRDPP